MSNIAKLGIGTGLVFVTEITGTKILSNLPNDHHTARQIKALALKAAAPSANLIASGSVEFLTTGEGDVTAITVDGINQLGSNEAGAGLTVTQLAANCVTNINGFTPSGVDYTAISIAGKVYLFAPAESGSDVNGDVVAMVTDAPNNITSTDIAISGGADANKDYDTAYGMRFFLDDSASAVTGTLSGTEITSQIIPRSLTSAVNLQTATLADNSVIIERKGQNTVCELDTEGSAATDTLDTIPIAGFSEGDTIEIRGASSGRVITIDEATATNIDLEGGATYKTAGYSSMIRLQLFKKGAQDGSEWYWFEVFRSPQAVATITNYRTSNLPFISTYGAATIALGTSGDITLTVNTDKQKQILTGTQTLSGNLTITLATADAIAGDQIIIEDNAKITIGAFAFKIANITLTATQALNGGYLILAYYDGAAWNSWLLLNMNNSATRGVIEDVDIATGTIKAASLEADLQTDQISIPISFETNEVGALKIPVYYEGKVIKIDIYVNKLIETSDDASVIIKDNSGTAMSTIVVTRNAAIGNNFNDSPTTDNEFSAGDVLTIETSKTTKGGKAFITMEILRVSP